MDKSNNIYILYNLKTSQFKNLNLANYYLKNLLKEEIGIERTDAELGIHLNPEAITNPKSLIENIIRLSKEDLPKRRRNRGLNISDLYQIIGQKIEISELEKLSSYVKFKNSLIEKLRELSYYYR